MNRETILSKLKELHDLFGGLRDDANYQRSIAGTPDEYAYFDGRGKAFGIAEWHIADLIKEMEKGDKDENTL